MLRPTLPAATAALALTLAACGSEPAKPLAEKTDEVETVEKKSMEALTFTVDASTSKVGFDMQAPVEVQDGSVPPKATTGDINIDFMDFTKSNGLVNVDIQEIELYQRKKESADDADYGERTKIELQQEHMRDWLEIGPSTPADVLEKNRVVQFNLKSIKDASATNVAEMEGAERTVTFTGVGDFRLHQRSATKEVKMEVVFHFDGDKATSLDFKTVEPVKVDLAEHDVRPRTGFGKLAEKTLGALSPKVGKEALVKVEFTAKPKAKA